VGLSLVSETTVVAEGLSASYGSGSGRVQALTDVEVAVQAGRLTAVLGPSGSGKSTLLHCLSGIARPDAGRVTFEGQDLTALDDRARTELRRTRMGFVFQRGNLAPALTVAENVSVGLVLRKLGRDDVRRMTDEALERCGIADRARAFPAELSGGQLQRVAMARAIAPDPAVLWADEPTGSLDRAAGLELVGLLHDAAQRDTTVVVVTHDEDVAAGADRVVRLRDGRLDP
jgi:putative ABC transport system ATP-binding protein